jgi:hypothetical protein
VRTQRSTGGKNRLRGSEVLLDLLVVIAALLGDDWPDIF